MVRFISQNDKILVTGATGFIGRALVKALAEHHCPVIASSRMLGRAEKILGQGIELVRWDGQNAVSLRQAMEDADVVVNLVGDSIAGGRWTRAKKQRILDSRLQSTHALMQALASARNKPHTLVQGSAMGYYGFSGSKIFTENSPSGEGFLAQVSYQWERASQDAEELGVRRVLLRTGVVLGKDGGALPQMAGPVRNFAGATPGTGKQWVSWIHIDDQVDAIIHLIQHKNLTGAFNLTAPEPATMHHLMRNLAGKLKRPLWGKIPAFAMRMALGQMAEETILQGTHALPEKLLESGFQFQYRTVEQALDAIY